MSGKMSQEGLLKECKFFNKSILDNRPVNVVANYKEVAKCYEMDLAKFISVIGQNALKAFKLLK